MLSPQDQAAEFLIGIFLTVCLMIPVIALYYLMREFVFSFLRKRAWKREREHRRALLQADRRKLSENRTLDAPKFARRSVATNAKPIVAVESAQEVPTQQRNVHPTSYGTVAVYGYGLDNHPFHEEAIILDASANGGVLQLSVPIPEGQNLLLIKEKTFETHLCRIVRVGARTGETIEVAVELVNPCPEFWSASCKPGDSAAHEQTAMATETSLTAT